MNKKLLMISLIIGIVTIIILLSNWRIKEKLYQYKFDTSNYQRKITTASEIEKVFSKFDQISYEKLDDEYKAYTKSNVAKYKKMLQDKNYYQLKRDDFFRFIVDDIRINQLLPKDKYYKMCLSDKSKTYNWLVDKKLLLKLLELQNLLEKKGYDKRGFSLTSCYGVVA